MSKTYRERLEETRARSLESNQEIYNQRSSEGRETGIVEQVIEEQRGYEQISEKYDKDLDDRGQTAS